MTTDWKRTESNHLPWLTDREKRMTEELRLRNMLMWAANQDRWLKLFPVDKEKINERV